MSSSADAHISKLSGPLQRLVAGATHADANAFGRSDGEQAEVLEWIGRVAQEDFATPAALDDLNTQLVPRTYVVSNYLTAADVALYGALHPVLSKLPAPDYYTRPALTRYFDHIQSRPSVRKSADALSVPLPLIPFDLDNIPKIARKTEMGKPKKPAAKTASAPPLEKGSVITPGEKGSSSKTPTAGKKDKEKKKPVNVEVTAKTKNDEIVKPPVTEEAGEIAPSMIDLRVGHIIDIKKHPDASGLYVEQIDVGEAAPREIVSGLVNYIPIEDMRDKYLVVVCNLKPASMRGVKSFGMVLVATSKDGKEAGMELIQPPPNSKPGDRIYFEGPQYQDAKPLSQLNPKKKIFEMIQPGFITLDTKEAAWIHPVTKNVHRIRTKEGVCVAPTLVGASLS